MSTYDLAVIGGGINGAGIARDAAGRGLSVLLIEKNDLASATSSASTKLIHGGLRYLEHYAFRLVRESLMERERLWAIAPHIVWPLRFVLPQMPGMRPAWMLRLGLFLYDHLGGREKLPATKSLNLTRDPAGKPLREGIRSGFEYSDLWVEDAPPRRAECAGCATTRRDNPHAHRGKGSAPCSARHGGGVVAACPQHPHRRNTGAPRTASGECRRPVGWSRHHRRDGVQHAGAHPHGAGQPYRGAAPVRA